MEPTPSQTKQKKRPYWPYWYIRGKLYDLTPWIEKHPGGAEFLQRCQGIDCTAAFEVHHLQMHKAEVMLKKFEVSQTTVAPTSPWPQYDWSAYAKLRQRVVKRLHERGWRPGPSKRSLAIAIVAFIINLIIPFIWSSLGLLAIPLGLLYAMNMIIMTGFGHAFLHLNTRLQFFGDLGGFSSHTWKNEHCLEHHLYTNHPEYDSDVTKFDPLLNFSPSRSKPWQRYAVFYLFPLYASSFMLIRLVRPFEIIRDPKNWKTRTIWFFIGSFGWFILWGVNGHLWTAVALECLSSFLFLSLTLSNHNHSTCHFAHFKHDFIKHQIDCCYDFGYCNYWYSCITSAFLGSQTLHHLFPTLDPEYFDVVESELKRMGYHYHRHSFWYAYWDHFRFISGRTPANGSKL